MFKGCKRLVYVFLIITFLCFAYVKFNSFGAFNTSKQHNDSGILLKQLPLDTDTISEDLLSNNTGTTSEDQFSDTTDTTFKDQSSDTTTTSKYQPNALTLNFSVQYEEGDSTKIKTVFQFRNLVNKLVHCSDECENITKQETLHLPQNILTDPTFLRIVKRIRKSKEGCSKDSPELKTKIIQNPSMILITDNTHHLSVCFNAKAASSSFVLYSKVLTMNNIITNMMEKIISNHIRAQLKPNTSLNALQGRKRDLPNSNMKVVVVRHPFRRLISAYNDKWHLKKFSQRRVSSKRFQTMISLSLLPDSETTEFLGKPKHKLKCSHILKGTTGELKLAINAYGQEMPTFRGFVLSVIAYRRYCEGKLACLRRGDRHMMTQVLRCGPCLMNYDAIMKIETFQEDLSLIGRVLGIESAWRMQQQFLKERKKKNQESISRSGILATNAHEKKYPYRDYMNQLAPHEMDMLYEVYANDFAVFGYDPCQDINSTIVDT